MNIAVTYGDALQQDTPLLVLGTWEDEALPEAVAGLVEDGDWWGQFRQTLIVYPRGVVPARRLLLIGLGQPSAINAERLCDIAALAAQYARDLLVDRYAFVLPTVERLSPEATTEALTEGSLLGLYRFLNYKSKLSPNDRHEIEELTFVANSRNDTIERGVSVGSAIARGVALARDLANGPGNDVTPAKLGEVAQELGERFDIPVTIFGPKELQQQEFGGLLNVAKGSSQPPRFIILDHGARTTDAPTICLVGKGITFDSGGISIKPTERMDEMKTDMSGAAAVLGTMQVVGELKLPIHVVGLISAAENMPSSTAYKPGDVVKTLSGKTIEVITTDAEGRIVLADALFYAQRYQPDAVIDLATLTGAIVVALGPHATGLMSNDDNLADRILQASEATGERAWRMPLWEPYNDMIKSDIADIKNSGGRAGGALTAAAFLSHFVGQYHWAHLDIAGTARADRQTKAYIPKGATGVGVRLLVQALRTWTAQ